MTSKRFNLMASAASPRRRCPIARCLTATVSYARSELGVLYRNRGVAELPVLDRYRDVRGEDDPYSSQDPYYPQGRLDQR
jgi:hypothetical protein